MPAQHRTLRRRPRPNLTFARTRREIRIRLRRRHTRDPSFHAHLFSDFLLQPFFFVVNIVGWVAWLRHRGQDGAVTVVQCSKRQILLALMGTAAGALLLGMLTKRFGAAYPFWDGTVAAASVTGQLLLTWRKIENWLWWIGADVVAIGVYTAKGLYLTAGLYAVFLVMAALGYVSWRRTLSTQQEPAVS